MIINRKLFLFPIFLIALLSVSLFSVYALNDTEPVITEIAGETAQKNLAFTWIASQVKSGWPVSTEDNAFALLALSSDSKLRDDGKTALKAKNIAKTGSNIKDSSLALFALNNIGEDTDYIEEWLLTQKQPFKASNLEWRIQLDYSGATSCDITYGSKTDSITINDDKTISVKSSGIPNCLYVADNYWLGISSSADSGKCYEKTYAVNCDDTVRAALLYKKGTMTFVPSKTQSSNYLELKIESICLADKSGCDYSSNLWAAYALSKSGVEEVNTLLPYLVSQEEVEENNLPYAFLYLMTQNEDYASGLLKQQLPKGNWYTVKYGKWYSTALAYLALKDSYEAAENITKVKRYILNGQNEAGSWENNLRDSSFLFYALWPSYYAPVDEGNLCTEKGYKCSSLCDSSDEEEIKEYTFYCGDDICCKEKKYSLACTLAEDCADYDCNMFTLPNNCRCEYEREKSCDDNCDNDADGLIDDNDLDCQISECEANGYSCCTDCEWGHKSQYDYSCELGSCCKECARDIEICDDKEDNDDDTFIDCKDPDCELNEECRGISILWYIIPALIIILAGVYVYFNKTQGFNIIDFFKDKFSKSKQQKPARPLHQQEAQQRPVMRQGMPPTGIRHFNFPSQNSETDTELEKTMQKLKDMSKKK